MASRRLRGVLATLMLAACALCAAAPAQAQFATLSGVTRVDAGTSSTCAIGAGGVARCWGRAPEFWAGTSLGRSTFGGVAAPVDELGPVTDISVGATHMCAVTVGGGAMCFGHGASGQLGTGVSGTSSLYPAPVLGLHSGVSSISAGYEHSCAVTTGGAAKCWGSNSDGQLGNGTQDPSNAPVNVTGIATGATQVSAGGRHSCAAVAGAARCWGLNSVGQLGDASTTMRVAPVTVQGLASGVTRISAGDWVTCAVHAGAAKCWGSNTQGTLGDGTLADFRATPAQVVGLTTGVVDIVAGTGHACAIRNAGELWCWGNNFDSQLGDGTRESRNTPVLVTALSGPVASVAVGDRWTCARLVSGTLECFGANELGQLGIGSLPSRFAPVDAAVGAPPWAGVDGGETHSCGVGIDAVARCWGNNDFGMLGDGSGISSAYPVEVPLGPVAKVTAGRTHSCAATPSGQAYCWGEAAGGQLGLGGSTFGVQPSPQLVPGIASVTDIAAGTGFTCAVAGGGAQCWGETNSGGDPRVAGSPVPAPVPGLPATIVSVTAGQSHACVLRTNGGIKCWGWNITGQLGDGTQHTRSTPADVVGLSFGAKGVAAGATHTCAVSPSNGALCWGANGGGQIGDGTHATRLFPTPVTGLQSGVVAVAAGTAHSCALTAGGGVKCWGSNLNGELGRATPGNASNLPLDVVLPGPAVAITAGASYSCAILAGGAMKCWGRSAEGQLGNGDTRSSAIPRTVVSGDFPTTLAISSSADPAVHGQPVEISLTIGGGALPAGGSVVLRQGSQSLCEPTLGATGIVGYAFGGFWKCTVLLSPGTHTLVATYSGDAMHSAAVASIQQVVTPIPGQACADFDDVLSQDALCRSVDWVRNRGITLGCTGLAFCPTSSVNRLSMAAFVNRAGRVLSPQVETYSSGVAYWFGSSGLVCSTAEWPSADHPRDVLVDAVISGTALAPVTVELKTAQGGFGFSVAPPGAPVRSTFGPAGPSAVRVSGTFTLPAGRSATYGVFATSVGGGADHFAGTCTIRAVVTNRNETYAPYDQ